MGGYYIVRDHAAKLLAKIAAHDSPTINRGLPPSEYEPVK
jgi:hypothetical protein